MTVGTIVILEIFDSCVGWTQVNIQLVVDGLTRIFDIHAKVRGVDIILINFFFNCIGSFNWTSKGYPLRWLIFLLTEHFICCFLRFFIYITCQYEILFCGLYYLIFLTFKRDSWKYISSLLIPKLYTLIVEDLHISQNGFTLYWVNWVIVWKLKFSF